MKIVKILIMLAIFSGVVFAQIPASQSIQPPSEAVPGRATVPVTESTIDTPDAATAGELSTELPDVQGQAMAPDRLTQSLAPLMESESRLQSSLAQLDMSLERSAMAMALQETSVSGDEPKYDAPHQLYKEAYNLILDEQWADARKKFAELKTKYPKSEFMDDATYWSAYAEKSIDAKKALKEYKDFIAKYPNSQYYDDAVADMDQLKADSDSEGGAAPRSEKWKVYQDDSSGTTVISTGKAPKAYSVGSGNSFTFSTSQSAAMARLRRDMKRNGSTLTRLPRVPRLARLPRLRSIGGATTVGAPAALSPYWSSTLIDDEKLDEKTRLKMDALEALGDTKEDSLSFRTLRDVALDKKQPRELRITALGSLSNFRKFDVLPIFIQVAKTETDPDLQNTSIDVISDLGGEKTRGVDALIEIYRALPASSKDQRSSLFYAIADIGNDKAVDFLASVAKSSDDYDLKREAISYLGNIGGEKARKALLEILKDN